MEMQRMFDRSATGLEAGRELLRLCQGHDTISNYSIEFQTLATDRGWEGRALVDAFLHGRRRFTWRTGDERRELDPRPHGAEPLDAGSLPHSSCRGARSIAIRHPPPEASLV